MIGWIGTVASVVGSFLVAFQLFFVGYCFFIVGSVSWLYLAHKMKNRSLATLNGFFLTANIIGIWNVI